MGHGLSRPELPLAWCALAVSLPAVSTDLLRCLERFAAQQLSYDAATFGSMLKAYGLPLFALGHYMQCMKKPQLELPDWSYLIADVFHTSHAVSVYRKKPLPEALLLAGLLWSGAFLPMRWRLLAAKQPALVPTFGNGAGVTMALLGITQLAVKYGLIKSAPNGPITMQQAGTFSGLLFFICTYVKLFQLMQQGNTQDGVFYGQCWKTLATTMCSIGNFLGHGLQNVRVPGSPALDLVFVTALASALRTRDAKKVR